MRVERQKLEPESTQKPRLKLSFKNSISCVTFKAKRYADLQKSSFPMHFHDNLRKFDEIVNVFVIYVQRK
jgi:hypothetical protein